MNAHTNKGRFGKFGGRYVPETLVPALDELEYNYKKMRNDARFKKELAGYLRTFAGRPTPMYYARTLTKYAGGARIYLKREDLLHGGAHKINNALGQALLAKRMGKTRILAETGAGQHGVATAMACALLEMKSSIYMGRKDLKRQAQNAFSVYGLIFERKPVVPYTATMYKNPVETDAIFTSRLFSVFGDTRNTVQRSLFLQPRNNL